MRRINQNRKTKERKKRTKAKKKHIERINNNKFGLHKGPVDFYKLPCVVQVEGRQPAVVGQLEGKEDDWVQAQLED